MAHSSFSPFDGLRIGLHVTSHSISKEAMALHWQNYLIRGCGDYVMLECQYVGSDAPEAVNLSLNTEGIACDHPRLKG